MKPSPERLRIDAYPRVYKLETRFSDVDRQQHLNNVAIASFYEDARVRMHEEIVANLKDPAQAQRMVAANVSIAYLHEGFYPDIVTITCEVAALGRTSHTIGQALFQNGRCIGVAETVLVYRGEHGPAPIPDELRGELERLRLKAI